MIDSVKRLILRPRVNGVLIGILIAIVGQNLFPYLSKHYDAFHDHHFAKGYNVVFVADEFGFLTDDALVYRNGMKIGIVDKIRPFGERSYAISAKIFDGFTIPKASIRTISEQGFSGPRIINISDARVSPSNEYFHRNYSASDTIQLRYETGFYESVLYRSTVLFSKIDSIYAWTKNDRRP